MARTALPDSVYRKAAKLYRRAAREGVFPAPLIVEELGCTTSSAHRYVRIARERGFLAPALAAGTAGEASTPLLKRVRVTPMWVEAAVGEIKRLQKENRRLEKLIGDDDG